MLVTLTPSASSTLSLMGRRGHVHTDERHVLIAFAGQFERGVEVGLSAARVTDEADELAAVIWIAATRRDLGHRSLVAVLCDLRRAVVAHFVADHAEVGADFHLVERLPVDANLLATVAARLRRMPRSAAAAYCVTAATSPSGSIGPFFSPGLWMPGMDRVPGVCNKSC